MLLAFQVSVSGGGGSSSGNLLTWTSPELSPNMLITVRVRALNGFGFGDFSEPETIMTGFGGML